MGDSKKYEKCLKKSNILVYQQPTGQRTERKDEASKHGLKIPICTPKPKQIKICTGAELRKMCPSNVCPCEPVKKHTPSFNFGGFKFLGFGIKSLVAAAAIYVTYDMGIWGTTDDTQELYGTACHIFGAPKQKKNDKWDPPSCEAESELFRRPTFNPYGHCDDPPLRAEDTYLKFKKLWNGAVSTVFHGMANFPDNVIGKRVSLNFRGKSEESEEENQPACVPESEEESKITNSYK